MIFLDLHYEFAILTTWMINDFYHLMDTDNVVDEPLAVFNRNIRANIVLPDTWNQPNIDRAK